ncbi:GMC family oxidoreductase [Microbacterium betulae]|uniref:GMC family oxidoreductase n=1 Tax=Microbacterium betulae TaxID=2981139 RepID=A0AA97FJQ8_9MICO|nr:GMC family oxidoreductase [Microbacterium sp. AB]WOF24034.1 GMC family oxidoreductase [Microbacterium sp. AB]
MTSPEFDVLIVGGGLMGAGLARAVRDADPDARIAIVEAGPAIGGTRGQHLHEIDDPELWRRYNRGLRAGTQAHYVGAAAASDPGSTAAHAEPGVYRLGSFGEDADELPGAAIAWNSGGMGAHWTAATPTPYGAEVFAFGGRDEWDADLARARELLQVHPDPYGQDPAAEPVIARLRELFDPVSAPGRGVQAMPMAVQPVGDAGPHGPLRRTSPRVIFPPIADGSDPAFTMLSDSLCLGLVMDGSTATGARVRHLPTGGEREVTAARVAVCADAMRTPQLLFASGIRPPALGRRLNEHVFVSGRVLVDAAEVPLDLAALRPTLAGEWHVASHWLPHSGARQPFQGQIMSALVLDEDLRTPLGYFVQLSWYVPTETREENRVEFSETETDVAGLPRMRVRFSYSDADRRMIAEARAAQRRAGEALGDFVPGRDSEVLAPGSSLHYTGTVRMGLDPETSVCDPDGRVWGTDNVYVAGNGVIPTPMTANTTLTGMVTVVRAARAVASAAEASDGLPARGRAAGPGGTSP